MLLEFQEAGPLFRDDGPPGVLILQLKDGVFRTISGRWQPAFVTNEEGLTKVGIQATEPIVLDIGLDPARFYQVKLSPATGPHWRLEVIQSGAVVLEAPMRFYRLKAVPLKRPTLWEHLEGDGC